MIDEASPPDLVLDLTYSDDMMKSISLNLGLPTLTSSLGDENDIKQDPILKKDQGPAMFLAFWDFSENLNFQFDRC